MQIEMWPIADSKLAKLAEWGTGLLPIKFNELKAADYDIELLGFDADELVKIFSKEEG